ncbi:hypothetical protein ACFW2X_32255 [Streptomyces antibioticus]
MENARDAFASGMHLALLTGAGAAVLGAVAVAVLLRTAHRPADTPTDADLSTAGQR